VLVVKRVIIILVCVVAAGFIFVFVRSLEPQMPDPFRSAALDSINAADKIVLEAGDFSMGYSRTNVMKFFDWPLRARGSLVRIFMQRPWGFGRPVSMCHWPHHCIRCLDQQGREATILVCFKCDTISFADMRYHAMPKVYTHDLKRLFEEVGFAIDGRADNKTSQPTVALSSVNGG